MKIKVKGAKEIWLVEIDGAIKSGMEFDLADQLERYLQTNKVPKIIIDMGKVPFINSAALGIFLNTFREVEKKYGRFALCSVSEDVEHLLEITKLGSVFEIFRNQEDALDSFKD